MKKIKLMDSRIRLSEAEMRAVKAKDASDDNSGWDPDDFEFNCTGTCDDGTQITCSSGVEYCMKQSWEDEETSGLFHFGALKCGDSDWVKCPGFEPAVPSGAL